MIEIYGAQWCGHCTRAKDLCNSREVEFTYYDVDENDNKQNLFDRMDEKPETIPQIFIDGDFFPGGFLGLRQHFNRIDEK
jgi:glutaredoxin 1